MRRFDFVCVIATLLLASVAAAKDNHAELVGWIESHGGSADELVAWPELQFDGGTAFRTKGAVYLKLAAWPASNRVVLPRLNNPIKNVHLIGKPKDELKLTPEPTQWLVDLPKTLAAGAPGAVVMTTVGAPQLPPARQRIAADKAGTFVLHAHEATTHGEMLRYEPQPHKNTIGYWTRTADWAAWRLDVQSAGGFAVQILQGCGKGQGGSTVGIHLRQGGEAEVESELGEPALRFVVQDTGHFQNFVLRELGNVELNRAGIYTLELRPERLANKAVMDVRQVRLVPLREN